MNMLGRGEGCSFLCVSTVVGALNLTPETRGEEEEEEKRVGKCHAYLSKSLPGGFSFEPIVSSPGRASLVSALKLRGFSCAAESTANGNSNASFVGELAN